MKNLKGIIKDKRNTGSMPTLEKFSDLARTKKYVSFDIFDTLLKRNVTTPSDVFDLVQLYLPSNVKYSKKIRIEAERIARKNSSTEEITLKDIYTEYLKYVPGDLNELVTAELKAEESVLVANLPILTFYQKCVELGKKVYIISDMYLPQIFIEKVLSKNGIENYEKLYVSCEMDSTKRTGNLFERYLQENSIDVKYAIHIGDSWNSDYKQPKLHGIDAVHIPLIVKNQELVYGQQNIETNYLSNYVNKTMTGTDKYYSFGYRKFGPFLWGYVKWIHSDLVRKGISDVYFFSRDGFIMKKAYDLLYPNANIKSHYLEVSRRSLRVPILWLDNNFATILGMVSPSKRISIRSIFDCVGLRIDDYVDLLNRYNFSKDSSFDRSIIEKDNNLINMYSELKDDIVKNSKIEYRNMVEYLKQQEVSGKFAIVDIGWSGGMQRFLEQTLDKLNIKHDIQGYYIGVADYYTRNEKVHSLNLKGYLFDFKNDENAKDKRSSFVGLFETLFLEQDGSVNNYYKVADTGIVAAKRLPYEYIVNGKETFEYKSVKEIQAGAMDFIGSVNNSILNNFDYSADCLFEGLRKTGQDPTKNDIEMFGNFRFYDEGEDEYLANPKSLMYYIFNIKDLKTDFLSSRWKTGFLKKLLKVKLPYEKMYEWLLRFK
ncbi:glycosyltransferase [Ligilactobacillus agilis]|uniref:HAD family hydrolase n=1 Tax=Ligilactobacillus agilis TaxID=1601 RepID=UPI001F56E7E6|nr:glycosyltransferase [Ligilactobacillus agilis]UNL42963.1 glycosyltransferase [Ligilactobacillus agilis]UNL57933.1 glycosyltransferase [Ligilactobacillus agilis]